MKTPRSSKPHAAPNPGLRLGFRSGLEEKVAGDLTSRGVLFTFEKLKVKYTMPESNHTYTPDFQLANGIIVETKGRFLAADRKKHLLIQQQRPDLDIRFVFQRAKTPITTGSATTLAMWADKNGFKWAEKLIPEAWLQEKQ